MGGLENRRQSDWLQTYVQTQDKEFAASAIDAIGRCAANIKEVTDVCLSGLVNLMANKNGTSISCRFHFATLTFILRLSLLLIIRHFRFVCSSEFRECPFSRLCFCGNFRSVFSLLETVVAQSVVVIKRLLQLQPSAHKDIIMSMAKLIDSVRVPAARASIVWLIGEYCRTVPLIAPDVLRKMAKSFIHEVWQLSADVCLRFDLIACLAASSTVFDK